jgi:hypothetical protein
MSNCSSTHQGSFLYSSLDTESVIISDSTFMDVDCSHTGCQDDQINGITLDLKSNANIQFTRCEFDSIYPDRPLCWIYLSAGANFFLIESSCRIAGDGVTRLMSISSNSIVINGTEFDGVGLQISDASVILVDRSEFRVHLSSADPPIIVNSTSVVSTMTIRNTQFDSTDPSLPDIRFDSENGVLTIGSGCCFARDQTSSINIINGDVTIEDPTVWNCRAEFTEIIPNPTWSARATASPPLTPEPGTSSTDTDLPSPESGVIPPSAAQSESGGDVAPAGKGGLKTGAIAGIAVAGAVALGGAAVAIFIFLKRRRGGQHVPETEIEAGVDQTTEIASPMIAEESPGNDYGDQLPPSVHENWQPDDVADEIFEDHAGEYAEDDLW